MHGLGSSVGSGYSGSTDRNRYGVGGGEEEQLYNSVYKDGKRIVVHESKSVHCSRMQLDKIGNIFALISTKIYI